MWYGCKGDSYSLMDMTMQEAGDNVSELQKTLDAYRDKRHEAAKYLIEGMLGQWGSSGRGIDSIEAMFEMLQSRGLHYFEGDDIERVRFLSRVPIKKTRDAETISSDYLRKNIDDAWGEWQSKPWAKKMSFEQFCEYILPYRIGDEELTDWREAYRGMLGAAGDSAGRMLNAVDAARIVSEKIGAAPYNDQVTMPRRTALNLLKTPMGYCRDDCDRTLYAMRSIGIPTATDMIIASPDNGLPHSWNVVFDTDENRMRMFDNLRFLPTRDSVHNDLRRKGKVYRQLFRPETERLKRYRNAKYASGMLLNPRLRDVTAEYFGHNAVRVETDGSQEVYLGIFTPKGYKAVDIGECDERSVLFRDIEPRVMFFPVSAREGALEPCGYPFMLLEDGTTRHFVPDAEENERVTLIRKMPLGAHQTVRFAPLKGLKIQGGDSANGPWEDLDSLESAPIHNMHEVRMREPLRHRWIRLMPAEGSIPDIAGIRAFSDSAFQDEIFFEIEGPEAVRERQKNVTDREILSYYTYEDGDRGIIVRNDRGKAICRLFVNGHNDDNFVMPGEEYELMYFSGDGWQSAGRKTATGLSIDFDVPKNAALWLRNRTKGREEQVCYWEGRQVF